MLSWERRLIWAAGSANRLASGELDNPQIPVLKQPQRTSKPLRRYKVILGEKARLTMAKPLISSTLFSFPKLLLWSLPLLFILIYTYLFTGLDTQLSTLVSFVFPAVSTNSTIHVLHDSSFSPDFVLRVAEQPFTQSCITKSDVILINGTFPGPEIRLIEGNIYWIRVFNDMNNKNLTMASEI
jgi:hypothetical protein